MWNQWLQGFFPPQPLSLTSSMIYHIQRIKRPFRKQKRITLLLTSFIKEKSMVKIYFGARSPCHPTPIRWFKEFLNNLSQHFWEKVNFQKICVENESILKKGSVNFQKKEQGTGNIARKRENSYKTWWKNWASKVNCYFVVIIGLLYTHIFQWWEK